jgi:hypothetical protein
VVVLSPHCGKSVHERYKEAWKLLDSRKHVSVRAAGGDRGSDSPRMRKA